MPGEFSFTGATAYNTANTQMLNPSEEVLSSSSNYTMDDMDYGYFSMSTQTEFTQMSPSYDPAYSSLIDYSG